MNLSRPSRPRRLRVQALCAAAIAVGATLWLGACGADSESGVDEPDSGVRDRPDLSGPGRPADSGAPDTPSDDFECATDGDCHDENPCTSDRCVDGACRYVPTDGAVAPIAGNCRDERCEDGVLVLEVDDEDLPADDGFDCTSFFCEDGQLLSAADNNLCDDGNRCNGVEVCDLDEGCRDGPPADLDDDGIADVLETEADDPPNADGDGLLDCADWESCDGLDNDGNGLVDDNPLDEELGDACYTGPGNTDGVGACSPGSLVCRGGEVVCDGQLLPADFELCDGQDNDCDGEVPVDEVEAFCRREVELTRQDDGVQLMRLEFSTALRLVDVQFNVDTTGSMSGALETLRESLQTDIVPGVAEVIPEAAFGVSTFEDYPVHNFGSGNDLPYELWQRVTTDVARVQTALGEIDLGSGNDIRESGVESLYQIATGSGTRWPNLRPGESDLEPASKRGFMAEISPTSDVDYYRLDVADGEFVSFEVIANRVGSSLNPVIDIYDATGAFIRRSDDGAGFDPLLNTTLEGTPPFYLRVSSSSGFSRGWYYIQVSAVGQPLVPVESACSELEVGGEFFAGAGGAVPLLSSTLVLPRSDYESCFADCQEALADTRAAAWIRSYCFAGGTPTCGNGELDLYEECDDGDSESNDGCSAICGTESDGVPPFNPEAQFDPALGHGLRGGVGFRDNSFPIIVHATDAPSHDQLEYQTRDPGIEAHDTESTFLELEKLGARIVGIAARDPARASIADLLNPPGMAFRTESNVPPCAFDGSEPRVRDVGQTCFNNADCYSGRCFDDLCQALCEPDECCVGIGGTGRPPPAGADGLCTLSFEMDGTGSGLTDGVVRGIQALARFATYQVTPIFHDHPDNQRDARCFIQSVEVAELIFDEGCSPEPEFSDRDGDGTLETVDNATPQSRVIYAIEVENRDARDLDGDLDTFEPCGPPGTYRLTMDIVGDDIAVLSSSELELRVLDD